MNHFIINWHLAMGWHLYRIVTGRPAYKRMSDTWFLMCSFLTATLLAALLRWAVLHPASGEQTLIINSAWPVIQALTIYIGGLYLVSSRAGRSKSLFAAWLGVSAALDLIISGLYLTGLRDTVLSSWWGIPLEIGLMLVAAYRFYREPGAVKAAGYRATKGSF